MFLNDLKNRLQPHAVPKPIDLRIENDQPMHDSLPIFDTQLPVPSNGKPNINHFKSFVLLFTFRFDILS